MANDELIEAIRAAFKDVPYPGDDNIGHPEGRDDAEGVTEWLRGRDWQSLVSRRLWDVGLFFMTDEARHYYLPAYLIEAVGQNQQAIEGLLFCLGPRYSDNSAGLIRLRALLSTAQQQTIRDVLNLELSRRKERQQRRPEWGAAYWRKILQDVEDVLKYWNSD